MKIETPELFYPTKVKDYLRMI